jgi:uncharacterized membrane protein YgaE (UPF0421/DUF939 family)
MKRLIQQSLKIVLGVTLAILTAEIIGLKYSPTAGIICLVSIFNTRKHTYNIGIKRIVTAFLALVLASAIFHIAGHNLGALTVFLLIFVSSSTYFNASEGIVVGTVLVTHIYSINSLGIDILANEVALLIIGIAAAWLMSIFTVNLKDEIVKLQIETEELIREKLIDFSYHLINKESNKKGVFSLDSLDNSISRGMEKSIEYNNNTLIKDNRYYIRYFQMRRQQYQILSHMDTYMENLYLPVQETVKLSRFTRSFANELDEFNDGKEMIVLAGELESYYRQTPLPKTREEFENRAILVRYFSDIQYLLEIKFEFTRKCKYSH